MDFLRGKDKEIFPYQKMDFTWYPWLHEIIGFSDKRVCPLLKLCRNPHPKLSNFPSAGFVDTRYICVNQKLLINKILNDGQR